MDRTRLDKILVSFIEVDEYEEFLGAVAKLRM